MLGNIHGNDEAEKRVAGARHAAERRWRVSHTIKVSSGTLFHFNSDLSGEVNITDPYGAKRTVNGQDLREFCRLYQEKYGALAASSGSSSQAETEEGTGGNPIRLEPSSAPEAGHTQGENAWLDEIEQVWLEPTPLKRRLVYRTILRAYRANLLRQALPAEELREAYRTYLDGGNTQDFLTVLNQHLPKLLAARPSERGAEKLPADVLEFLTDLSKATEYRSHDLGFEDSISNRWKSDAADLLAARAAAPEGERTPAAGREEGNR